MQRFGKWVVAAGLCFGLTAPAAAHAAADEVDVRLSPVAVVSGTGVVTGRVRVACPEDMSVLEALVTLSQDDQTLFGQGFISRISCTGQASWYTFRVSSYDQPFHPGRAYVSAYVVVIDEAGATTLSAGDTRTIRVMPLRR